MVAVAGPLDIRFPGQYYDEETGLHYNRFRYYDPGIGRYVSADPIGQQGGINLFAYALSNPLKFYDWLGLDDFRVDFVERGQSGQNTSGETYGADVTVTNETTGETTFEGKGSTYPNDEAGKNYSTVSEGSYPAANTTMAEKQKPGLYLGNLPTTPGSPSDSAVGVFVHCGDSDKNRGSRACLTVAPDGCDDFFGNFDAEQRGITVNVTRPTAERPTKAPR